MKSKIVVTGSSGKAGRAVVRDLLEQGYDVLGVDMVAAPHSMTAQIRADLTDLGQTFDVLRQAEAVVHLAAIPAPGLQSEAVTFHMNVLSTYNVFTAATTLGLQRIVWASSETTLGLPFDRQPPTYVPIDEAHPLFPESSYALSKVLGEQMAAQFSRWHGIPIVGLRFSNIMESADYQRFPSFWTDPQLRKWNLWSYVDAHDVAQSCRLSLTAPIQGAEVFIIAAADTVMNRPNRDLLAAVFPTVPHQQEMGDYETLLSIDKARRILQYAPEHSWRDYISMDAPAATPDERA